MTKPRVSRPNRHNKNDKGQQVIKAQRRTQALDLRVLGASYRDIARTLGVSERTAYLDVQDGIALLDAVTKERAERVRDLELLRLDRMTAALAAPAMGGAIDAINTTVRLMERRAKLIGLDAPTKVAPTIEGLPGDQPFSFTLDFGGSWKQK